MARRRKTNGEANGEQLANLLASLATLEERVSNLIDEFQRERNGAQEHRRDLRLVINSLSESVRTLTAAVDEIKPVVSDYREKRAQAAGMVKLMRVMHLLGYSASAALGALAHRMLP